jgi:hypothetical protein
MDNECALELGGSLHHPALRKKIRPWIVNVKSDVVDDQASVLDDQMGVLKRVKQRLGNDSDRKSARSLCDHEDYVRKCPEKQNRIRDGGEFDDECRP